MREIVILSEAKNLGIPMKRFFATAAQNDKNL
jgi:hypothetical protein